MNYEAKNNVKNKHTKMTTIQINGNIDFQTLNTKISLLEHCCTTCQDVWQKWNTLITNVLDSVDNFKTCPWKLSSWR